MTAMDSQKDIALLINAEPATEALLRNELQQYEYRTLINSDLNNLDKELTFFAPDLIFIEWGEADDTRCLALCRSIAAHPEVQHSEIIIICESDRELIEQTLEAGATDYLVLPLKPLRVKKRIQNIIRTHRSESHARHLVYHDPLTGLPNRLLLVDRIEHAITRVGTQNKHVAVLMIDLDEFKLINDTLGHDVGDDLLAEVAQRLTGQVGELDTVARLGGDEFIVLIESVDTPAVAAVTARAINDLIRVPFSVGEHTLHVSCSTGIAMWPHDGNSIGRLLKHADTAMYKAKDSGKNQFRFYQTEMEDQVSERLSVSNDIRSALDNDEFVVFYQPQVDFESGKVLGMEALVRWQHPTRGMMSPGLFLPVAEENGLIVQISDQVMEKSCAQIRQWRDMGLQVPHVAVNLSTRHFHQPELLARVNELLSAYELEGADLTLEITETTAMESPDAIIPVLQKLKGLGIGLAIDDFGTGHSSLAYLKRFPIDTLKIDRVFINDLSTDPDDEALVNGILSLAEAFGMQVVAEGVETHAQARLLQEKQCHVAQGFLYSRPIEAETMEVVLKAGYLFPADEKTDQDSTNTNNNVASR